VTPRPSQRQPEPHGAIDLHLHTTASDGRCTPRQLVERAAAAGLTAIAATDHDTTAAVAEVRSLAREFDIEVVSGIEITAVHDGIDVHMLGYFLDPDDAALQSFLASQRKTRIDRICEIAARLATLGYPIDERALQPPEGQGQRSVGRPLVAQAMIAAGYVSDVREAFDRWLGHGRPAFVPRSGEPPEAVIAIVHAAGGLVSLAHPGRTRIDERIPKLRAAGLDALEAFHSDHDEAQTRTYAQMADELGCLVTGGSDFHGDPARSLAPGDITLPEPRWQRLLAAAPSRG
jgi:predicted metal-dependent phosphoesterase TrpH